MEKKRETSNLFFNACFYFSLLLFLPFSFFLVSSDKKKENLYKYFALLLRLLLLLYS